jgi:hypothetical protein
MFSVSIVMAINLSYCRTIDLPPRGRSTGQMMALLIGKIHDGSRQNGMIWRHALGAVP